MELVFQWNKVEKHNNEKGKRRFSSGKKGEKIMSANQREGTLDVMKPCDYLCPHPFKCALYHEPLESVRTEYKTQVNTIKSMSIFFRFYCFIYIYLLHRK
jgi:hypothetical protein